MSGIIGGIGSKSGIMGETEHYTALHCSVILTSNLSINNSSGWYYPTAAELEVRHDPNGWWDDTNRRIIPKKAGIYLLYAHSYLSNGESGNIFGHQFDYVGVEGTFSMHSMDYSSMTNDIMVHSHHALRFDGVDDYILAGKYIYTHASTARSVISGLTGSQFGLTYIGEK
jgi:hypothetical protein